MDELKFVKQTFLGELFGVVLTKRTEDDNHVCFNIVVEHFGEWALSTNPTFSSGWVEELQTQLQAAQDWINKNGKGWAFKV